MTRFVSGVLAVALVGLAVGCSDNPADSRKDANLEANFGGYDARPEAPAFGDPMLMASGADEQDFDDPIAGALSYDSLAIDPEAGFFHMRILWGRLQLDSTVTTSTDWSGSLTISRGGLLLRKVIRFEPETDSILPRTDVNRVDWVSVTTVHNDGIAVDLVVPPPKLIIDTTVTYVVDTLGDSTEVIAIDTTEPAPVTVEFSTSPYTRTFSLAELARLDTIVYLDDSTAVVLNAFRVERIPCPRGFLSGSWGVDSTGLGVFTGTWMNRRGHIEGHVRGHFEEDSSGVRVFFGKWIDESGRFEGLLRGRWDLHPNFHADTTALTRAGGWFRGSIFDGSANPIGLLGGHFMSWEGNHAGFMQGRWKVRCPETGGDHDGMGDGMMGDGMHRPGEDADTDSHGGMGWPGGRR